jgi:hypothetical protein
LGTGGADETSSEEDLEETREQEVSFFHKVKAKLDPANVGQLARYDFLAPGKDMLGFLCGLVKDPGAVTKMWKLRDIRAAVVTHMLPLEPRGSAKWTELDKGLVNVIGDRNSVFITILTKVLPEKVKYATAITVNMPFVPPPEVLVAPTFARPYQLSLNDPLSVHAPNARRLDPPVCDPDRYQELKRECVERKQRERVLDAEKLQLQVKFDKLQKKFDTLQKQVAKDFACPKWQLEGKCLSNGHGNCLLVHNRPDQKYGQCWEMTPTEREDFLNRQDEFRRVQQTERKRKAWDNPYNLGSPDADA